MLGSTCNSENVINVTQGCIKTSGDDSRLWYDARNQCLTNGGDLAILNDNDLVTLRNSNKLIATNSHWIGLRKNAWYWISQRTGLPKTTSTILRPFESVHYCEVLLKRL